MNAGVNDIGLNFNAESFILWTNAHANIVCMVSQYEVLTAGMCLVKCQLASWCIMIRPCHELFVLRMYIDQKKVKKNQAKEFIVGRVLSSSVIRMC